MISHIVPAKDHYMELASILGFVGLLSPMVVAFWLVFRNASLKEDVLSRVFTFKSIKAFYLFVTFFLMPASILLAQAISLLFGYSPSQFAITGHFTFSSGIFPVWFMLVIAPLIEELAWHSYGTDCLRQRFNLFKTSLIFGVFWALWHIPLGLINNYYHSNIVETGWIHGVNFLVSVIPFVLLMNWLYYKTGRNILVVTIFHISAGFFNEIFATHPDSKVIQTVLLSVLAFFIIMKDKDFFFKTKFVD